MLCLLWFCAWVCVGLGVVGWLSTDPVTVICCYLYCTEDQGDIAHNTRDPFQTRTSISKLKTANIPITAILSIYTAHLDEVITAIFFSLKRLKQFGLPSFRQAVSNSYTLQTDIWCVFPYLRSTRVFQRHDGYFNNSHIQSCILYKTVCLTLLGFISIHFLSLTPLTGLRLSVLWLH